MLPKYPLRVLVGMPVFLVLCLLAAADFYTKTRADPRDPYQVSKQVDRFREAAQASPAGVVGYVSDLPFNDVAGVEAFLMAQYSLAPRRLVSILDAPGPDWVIGDFSHSLDYDAFGKQHRLLLVRDFGTRVVLYRRQTP